MPIRGFIRSWLMFAPLIPSITVIIFCLYYFLHTRAIRTALNNHVIIVLLFCCLIEQITDISWQIHFYRTGTSLIQSEVFCRIWGFLSGTGYASVSTVMTWASIERHILIFHSNWFGSKTKRLFFHYLPLMLTIIWPIIFYSLLIFILPCSISINYNQRFCGTYSCVSVGSTTSGLIDSVGNFMSTAFLTTLFSVTLFIRVIYQKHGIQQRVDWRNYKKLAVQLLPISILYIALQVPPMILYAGSSAGQKSMTQNGYYSDGLFFTYWIIQFIPFLIAVSIPEWQMKIRNVLLFRRRQVIVGPQSLTISRQKGGNAVESRPAD